MSRIAIIGAGAFGTALGCSLAADGNKVIMLAKRHEHAAEINSNHSNTKYLPQIELPKNLTATTDFEQLGKCAAVLMATPAQTLRTTLNSYDIKSMNCPIVLCSKGIEKSTGLLQSDIAEQSIVKKNIAVLSGPGFAIELAAGKPTALTLGAFDEALGISLQKILSTPTMRLYQSTDPRGVQLGGALKNVFAIACGMVVAADLGESARSALITRGFAELTKLAVSMGADTKTLLGLSGFGDLTLTCTSEKSRNFSHGLKMLADAQTDTKVTVEGIATALATVELAQNMNVDMPITQHVASVLENKISFQEALKALMSRPLKSEI